MHWAIRVLCTSVIIDAASGNLFEVDGMVSASESDFDDYYEDLYSLRAEPTKEQCGDLLEIIASDKSAAGKEALGGVLKIAATASGAEIIKVAVTAKTFKVPNIDGKVFNEKGEKVDSNVKAAASATSSVAGGVGLTCLLIGVGALVAAPLTGGGSVAAGIAAIASVAAPVGLTAAAVGAGATVTSLGLKASEIDAMGKYAEKHCKEWIVESVNAAGKSASVSLVEKYSVDN